MALVCRTWWRIHVRQLNTCETAVTISYKFIEKSSEVAARFTTARYIIIIKSMIMHSRTSYTPILHKTIASLAVLPIRYGQKLERNSGENVRRTNRIKPDCGGESKFKTHTTIALRSFKIVWNYIGDSRRQPRKIKKKNRTSPSRGANAPPLAALRREENVAPGA